MTKSPRNLIKVTLMSQPYLFSTMQKRLIAVIVLAIIVVSQAVVLGPSDKRCTDAIFTGSDNTSPCRCCSIDCNQILLFKKVRSANKIYLLSVTFLFCFDWNSGF